MSELSGKDHDDMEIIGADDIVAKVPKESMKALLYMLAGKPDSNIKLFHDPICITPADVIELNNLIQEKLTNHSVEAAITTVNIVYAEDEIEQYGIWAEFVDHHWSTHKETESITVKWDFFVNLPAYKLPQRHTVVLKIASELTPLHVMQAVFSKDPDEIEKLESEVAPVVCRIDFINHVLSDELMRIIENWHKALIKPLFNYSSARFLSKHRDTIARVIHYSIPFFATIIAAGILNKYVSTVYQPNIQVSIGAMKSFMFWLLGSAVGITFLNQTLGHWLGSKAYNAIEHYGSHSIFDFTNGDKNKRKKLEQKNKSSLRNLFFSISGAIVINLISSIIAYFLFR